MELVHKENDLAGRRGDFGKHRLEPVLKLSAVLGTRHERTQVEAEQPLAPKALRHISAGDSLRDALHDGRLAHTRLADENRVVLRPPAQHLQRTPNLLIAPDDRVELARPCRLREVARILCQRLKLRLGLIVHHPLAPAQVEDGLAENLRIEPMGAEQLGDRAVGLKKPEEEMLHRHMGVVHAVGLLLGDRKGLVERGREAPLQVARGLGQLRQLRLRVAEQRVDREAEVAGQRGREAILLTEQRHKQVKTVNARMLLRLGGVYRRLNGFAGLDRELL